MVWKKMARQKIKRNLFNKNNQKKNKINKYINKSLFSDIKYK
jgi:hypothetical protein